VGYLIVCPAHGLRSDTGHGGIFQRIFPWLLTLCQPVLSQHGKKWLNLPSMAPHNLWTSRKQAEVQPWTDEGCEKDKVGQY